MKPYLKWTVISVGSIVAIAHIGILGHLIREPGVSQVPTINIPRGPYSSYKIRAGKDGYEIEYRANDPKTLTSERSLDLKESKKGFFGGNRTIDKTEYRRDEYTANMLNTYLTMKRNVTIYIAQVIRLKSYTQKKLKNYTIFF